MEKYAEELIQELRSAGTTSNLSGMARYGIDTTHAFGTGMPVVRAMAKRCKKQHELSLVLWESGWHEARILAALIADPAKLTREQMDRWVLACNSWDLTDQCCMNLFWASPFALEAMHDWATREEEFVKRAAFATLASLALHGKKLRDQDFIALLPLIEMGATDERNFVKKSVNWALRQIGKRSLTLHGAAVTTAERLLESNSRSARWIARDALRELHNEVTIGRIRAKEERSTKTKASESGL